MVTIGNILIYSLGNYNIFLGRSFGFLYTRTIHSVVFSISPTHSPFTTTAHILDKSEFIGEFSTVFDGPMRRLITAPTEGIMICARQ